MAGYILHWDESAVEELSVLRPFEQRRILDETDEQLGSEPNVETRRRKRLDVDPPWEQDGPVWQLRVGDFRVFYDVDEKEREVVVKAIRKKGHLTTKEIL